MNQRFNEELTAQVAHLEEVEAVEEAERQHLEAHRYRIATKHDHIEVYE